MYITIIIYNLYIIYYRYNITKCITIGGIRMSYVLETFELTKEYSHNKVVDNVSLKVKEGEIYGFVGKNGAGKTTLIRMILGLATVSSGSYRLFEQEHVHTARSRIGSLVESPALYRNMSAKDNLSILCTMLGIDKGCINGLLEMVGLAEAGKKKSANFSLGMKQRLGLAIALLGDPDFLVLDEPLNGLDPKGIAEIRELLLSLRDKGKTIFISSHMLGELEKVATCYGIISSGHIVEELTAEELSKKCGSRTVVKTNDPEKAMALIKKLLPEKELLVERNKVFIRDEVEDIGRLTSELFNAGITVKGISTDENSKEEYFIKRMEE